MIQFYHLLHTPLAQALPKLLEKAMQAGMRAVVVSDSESKLQHLSDRLWDAQPDSFLAHGMAPDDAAQQPVWLSLSQENPNQANLLAITDGSAAQDVSGWDKVLDLFDGHDEQALQAARARWKAYKDAGVKLQYIQQQEGGGWKVMATANDDSQPQA